MAQRDEWIKYMTERVVNYIDTPVEQRKQSKLKRKSQQEHWLIRWFGMLTLALRMLVNKRIPKQEEHHE